MNESNMQEIQTRANGAAESLKDRVEHARDVVENIRDKAELAFRDKPYLLPVATGAGENDGSSPSRREVTRPPPPGPERLPGGAWGPGRLARFAPSLAGPVQARGRHRIVLPTREQCGLRRARRGHVREARGRLEAILAHMAGASHELAAVAAHAKALYWAGILAMEQGDAGAAAIAYRRGSSRTSVSSSDSFGRIG